MKIEFNVVEIIKDTDIKMVRDFFNFHRTLTKSDKEHYMSYETARETLDEWLKTDNFRIVCVNDLVVGFIYYKLGGQDFAWLEDIFLKEEFRGKGYGKKIVSKFFKMLKTEGVVSCVVNVIPRNEVAIKFYIECGFNHLNMIELRVNFDSKYDKTEEIEILGHKLIKY